MHLERDYPVDHLAIKSFKFPLTLTLSPSGGEGIK
jgi:hypothetical protein